MHPDILKQNVIHTISQPEDIYLETKDQDLIDAEIAEHEALLHSLVQRMAALKNHRNSLSQAWRLPIEVLGNIMLVATQLSIKENNEADVYPTTLPVPLTLGQICAAWRNLAWKLPELWSTIPLAVAKSCYEKQVLLLDDWLARAGDIQDLHIILTLSRDNAELQYWRDYPPKEVLTKLYQRSKQWHTFYSTLPNLCFDLFASVHEKLPRLNTLILNRSGRLAFDPFVNGFPGGINNLAPPPPPPPAPGMAGPNVIQNGVFVPAHGPGVQIMLNGATFFPAGAPIPPPNAVPLAGINLDTDTSHRKSPWYMLSAAPNLRIVVLPEALNPTDITLPWSNLTHLEVRTIPIDDCLRVLHYTPRIISFDFHGIFSGPLTFLPTPHLYLPSLRKFNVFSDPVNLSRFLDSLTTPNLYCIEFKSTTGTLSLVTSKLTRLIQRSGCRLRKLGVCIPSIGKSEEQIVDFCMGDEIRECLEELKLESWQVDVEGLSDSFLRKLNPERRVRSVKSFSYVLDEPGVDSGGGGGSGLGSGSGSDLDSSASGSGSGMSSASSVGSGHEAIIIAPGWVDVPTDEVREVVEQLIEVPNGEYVEPQEILLPNLKAMTYRGTLSFNPQVLKDTIFARWKRKSRRRTFPRLVTIPDSPERRCLSPLYDPLNANTNSEGVIGGEDWLREEGMREVVIMEEEDYFPTVELTAFEVHATETDFKDPLDDETNLAFREMLREGFYLCIETRKGMLAF